MMIENNSNNQTSQQDNHKRNLTISLIIAGAVVLLFVISYLNGSIVVNQ